MLIHAKKSLKSLENKIEILFHFSSESKRIYGLGLEGVLMKFQSEQKKIQGFSILYIYVQKIRICLE